MTNLRVSVWLDEDAIEAAEVRIQDTGTVILEVGGIDIFAFGDDHLGQLLGRLATHVEHCQAHHYAVRREISDPLTDIGEVA